MLLRLRNARSGIALCKDGQRLLVDTVRSDTKVGFDLIYTTRLAYQKRALTQPYGDEILFVGSGGVFEYAERAAVSRNLHRGLMVLSASVVPASGDMVGANYYMKAQAIVVVNMAMPSVKSSCRRLPDKY